jgi:hypothetical protein
MPFAGRAGLVLALVRRRRQVLAAFPDDRQALLRRALAAAALGRAAEAERDATRLSALSAAGVGGCGPDRPQGSNPLPPALRLALEGLRCGALSVGPGAGDGGGTPVLAGGDDVGTRLRASLGP